MVKNKPRILFFINGMSPTDEQREEAAALGPNVAFRNATKSVRDEAIEDFDDLAGDPPVWYVEARDRKAAVDAPPAPKLAEGLLPPVGSVVKPVAPAAGATGQGWTANA